MSSNLLFKLNENEFENVATKLKSIMTNTIEDLSPEDLKMLLELIRNGIEEENEIFLYFIQVILGLYDPDDIEYELYEIKD